MAIALLLVAFIAPAAVAWDASCSAGQVCIWRYEAYGVPLAAKTGSDDRYGDDVYPNTSVTLNDTASSIKNHYDNKDVVWFFDRDYEGTSFCLNPGWSSGQLNSHDNEYSSHLVASNSSC